MANYKNKKDTDLNNLLFSHGEESHNLSQEHSIDDLIKGQNQIDEIEEEENAFIYRMEGVQWNSGENIENQFLRMNGPSVQFSQNYSQNSMMLSHRQDDSRDYKGDKYFKILQDKKKEDILLNEALDQQILQYKQKLQRKDFQNTKLQEKIKALELKITKQANEIEAKQNELQMMQEQLEKMKQEKHECFQKMDEKDEIFKQYRARAKDNVEKLSQKQNENNALRQQIEKLEQHVEQLSQCLSVYEDGDRNLLNFRGKYTQPGRESPMMRNSSFTDKELDKLRKQKTNLEIELTSIRDKFEDRENRFKKIEEEQKKKLTLKEKKLNEVEQKLAELKDDQIKLKTQNQIQIQKLNVSLSAKSKQLIGLNERLSQADRRIKSLLQQCRKKDQCTRDVRVQLAQKSNILNETLKLNQEMKIKLDFDHQMIEDKDKQIEKLLNEKKTLRIQLENTEKIEKNEKAQKTQKDKSRKELERIKRENETIKRQNDILKKQIDNFKQQREALSKQKEELVNAVKQNKKKFEEVSKKMVQFRTNSTQMEEEMRHREQQYEMQREALDKAMRQLTELKKKNDTVPELRNKIILLESRLKNQHQYRDQNESMESQLLQDRIQALEQRLQQKDKQYQSLKKQMKTHPCSEDEMIQLEEEIAEREQLIETMEEEIHKKDEQIAKMQQQVAFKDRTLEFTHNVLVKSEKDKIQLQQQNNMLKQMLDKREEDGPMSRKQQDLQEFYDHQIDQLERKLEVTKRQQQQYRFELKQQKERIKQLNDMLLSKQRKFSPQTMSQEQTCAFLTKTLKRVVRSSQMLKMLYRSHDFRESFSRMDRQFRK